MDRQRLQSLVQQCVVYERRLLLDVSRRVPMSALERGHAVEFVTGLARRFFPAAADTPRPPVGEVVTYAPSRVDDIEVKENFEAGDTDSVLEEIIFVDDPYL